MTIFYKSIYNDGTSFTYSEDDKGTNDYKKIDRSKLIAFELYNDTKLLHVLHLDPGQRLICRRRVLKKWGRKHNPNWKEGDPENERMEGFQYVIILYLVGYQEKIKGENRQAITIIHQDGHTELMGKWKDAPYNPVNLIEEEQELLNA